jgi:hypothetical protein
MVSIYYVKDVRYLLLELVRGLINVFSLVKANSSQLMFGLLD